jgi:hypothetical protein
MHILSRNEALRLVEERRELFDAAGRHNPFACSAWELHFIEQVADEDWRFVVPAHSGDGESLMLLYSSAGQRGHLRAVTNYYASLYSPLISSAVDRQAALAALIRQIIGARPRYATLSLAPLEHGLPERGTLGQALSEGGWYHKEYFCFGNWYLPCADLSFEQYMEQRPSQLFNTWTRKARKFDSARTGARLELVTEPSQVSAGMEAYAKVYAKSWKKPEPYPGFVPGWAKLCAQNGWLRLGLAWVDDVPIAAQFWFTMHRRAYIFKLAYDEEHAKWSAGTVLTAHLIRHSLERDRVVEIDYLTGDDAYKQTWMSSRRDRVGLLGCNLRSANGLAAAAVEWAAGIRQRVGRRPAGYRGVQLPQPR